MSTHRRLRPRVDKCQPEIVKQLRDMGYSVDTNHSDILVGVNGMNIWIELKDDRTLRKDGRIKPNTFKESQIDLMRDWKGQYDTAWTLDEVLDIINEHLDRVDEQYQLAELRMLEDRISGARSLIRSLQKRYSELTGREYPL